MIDTTELRLAPPVAAMNAFIEPYRQWIEQSLSCSLGDSLTFEVEVPFGQFAAEEILRGAVLDRQCLLGAEAIRAAVVRWELPPGTSPRIELNYSRDPDSPITARQPGWDPHWRETPIAIWLEGLAHALVSTSIPYVSFADGIRHRWKDWLLVNPNEVSQALNLLGPLLGGGPKSIRVLGGRDIPLPIQPAGWDSLVLDPEIKTCVEDDFEFFLQREAWFRKMQLPFRRGYLFYGPPGNGKTSVARVMACQRSISAFSLDFSNEQLRNDALTELFETAAHWAPSLVIFEDLERLYGNQDEGQNRTGITLQHLLNCLDGLASRDGVIVLATANDPERLDPAILRRPGRFDRVVPFRPPSLDLRCEYLSMLGCEALTPEGIPVAAEQCDGFSFAQIREAYILAGQSAFRRGDERILAEDIMQGIAGVRNAANGGAGRFGERTTGFVPAHAGETVMEREVSNQP